MVVSGDLQRHVYEVLQPSYGKRYQKMVTAIEKELLPLGASLPQTDRDVVGGYFIWLTLPSGIESSVVVKRAKEEENIVVAQVRSVPVLSGYTDSFVQGEIFEVPGDTEQAGTHFENDIRYAPAMSRSHCSLAAHAMLCVLCFGHRDLSKHGSR